MKNNKKRKGFTLVELLVVIAILAILATVTVVGYSSFTEKANKSVDEQLCAQYNTVIKAGNVDNPDMTLAEFLILLEENGIYSNHFKTSSKSYRFAFNEKEQMCVLVDAETSAILYPEGAKSQQVTDLWAVLDETNRARPNIINYTLDRSIDLSELDGFTSSAYNFDLNNHGVNVQSDPSYKLNIKNGHLMKKQDVTLNNVETPEGSNVKVADASNSAIDVKADDHLVFDKVISNRPADSKAVWTIKDLNLFSSGERTGYYYLNFHTAADEVITTDHNQSKINVPGTVTKIVFEDCNFDNVAINFNCVNVDLVVKNCNFYNIYKNTIEVHHSKSITIENNDLINCKRGFNLNLSSQGPVIVRNNYFDLLHIESDKDEHKDNVVQIAFDKPEDYINDYSGTPTVKSTAKMIIENNRIKKANALLTIHSGLLYESNNESQYKFLTEHILVSSVIVCKNNQIENCTHKAVLDPGAKGDLIGSSNYGSETAEVTKRLTYFEQYVLPAAVALVH